MRECDNNKIHISSNFLLSICLIIMLDTLLLVPPLHCNTSLHFTTLHQTTLYYTYRYFTSTHLHFTTLLFGLTHLHFLSFYFPSPQTQYGYHIPELISKIMNPFSALKNLSPFHFTFFILFFFTYHINPSLNFPSIFTF